MRVCVVSIKIAISKLVLRFYFSSFSSLADSPKGNHKFDEVSSYLLVAIMCLKINFNNVKEFLVLVSRTKTSKTHKDRKQFFYKLQHSEEIL